MCGAVSIQYDPALKEELTKFLPSKDVLQQKLIEWGGGNGEFLVGEADIRRYVRL